MKRKPSLLPNRYRKVFIGLSIALLILSALCCYYNSKELFKTIAENSLLISLTLLALTKEKIEDEMIIRIRIVSLASAFLFGLLFTIISSFGNLLWESRIDRVQSATGLLFLMFLIYFLIYRSYKMLHS